MSGSVGRQATVALATGWLLGVTLAVRTGAGELPRSALSSSWGIDPILIDSPALLCQFPQLAVAADSVGSFGVPIGRRTLWATTDADIYYGADDENLGAIWSERAFGVFALAQPDYLAGGDFARAGSPAIFLDIYPQPLTNENGVLQAGAGARWGAVRAGVALRATRDRFETGNRDSWSDGTVRVTERRNEVDYQELALGLGADLHGARVDAAFEWQHELYEESYGESDPEGALASTLRGESRGTSAFVARIDMPVGEGLRLVAAGHYRWAERTWTGTHSETAAVQAIAFGERAKTWGAHAGIVVTAPLVDRLVFAASVVHYDEPLSGLAYSQLQALSRKVARGTATVAAEKFVWQSLALRAGVSGDYTKAEAISQSMDGSENRTRASEALTDRFHWGLAYRWRGLQFETSLRAPPVVDSPFEHFDLYWRF